MQDVKDSILTVVIAQVIAFQSVIRKRIQYKQYLLDQKSVAIKDLEKAFKEKY